jgi:AcrR family transcriptional regulator
MARRIERNGTSAPLSRERVLDAAVRLADEQGIDAVSMRMLAQVLGAGAMSLYHHVPNKDALLSGMVDTVLAEVEPTREDADWKTTIRGLATSTHDVLLRHRWAASLTLSGGVHQSRIRYMEAVLACLRSAGFSAEMAHHAYHALDSHIVGFTLWQVGMALDAEKLPGLAAAFMRDLDRERFPYVAEHIEQHFVPPTEYVGTEFDFGLDLILDGLERFRDAR